MSLVVSTGMGGEGDNSSCQPRTPGNPTEVEAMATVTEAVNVPVHTTVTRQCSSSRSNSRHNESHYNRGIALT